MSSMKTIKDVSNTITSLQRQIEKELDSFLIDGVLLEKDLSKMVGFLTMKELKELIKLLKICSVKYFYRHDRNKTIGIYIEYKKHIISVYLSQKRRERKCFKKQTK